MLVVPADVSTPEKVTLVPAIVGVLVVTTGGTTEQDGVVNVTLEGAVVVPALFVARAV